MLELVLVRHGETDGNTRGAFLGWTDEELNSEGLKQSGIVRDRLGKIKFDKIYSSPLKRARHTAEIINESQNIEIIYTESLKERNFGIWDNLTLCEVKGKYPEFYCAWERDWINYRIKEGESALDSYCRSVEFVDRDILSKNTGTYLIVSHSGLIRFIVSYLLGMSIEDSWRFRIDNSGVARIEVDNGYGVLTQLG
ncbi:MAG: histidine phosphatase family protein [Clostridiaceae bacterium]|nr:histidine phosphatase family protein [Clostridiaceae bacterium]